MQTHNPSHQSVPTADPRSQPGFQPHLFPQADHSPLPAHDGADSLWVIKLEFLAAFYDINACGQALRVQRQAGPDGPLADASEAEAALETAICAKEALDARYAARGIAASPHWDGQRFDDVTFSFPPRNHFRAHARFGVPRPPG